MLNLIYFSNFSNFFLILEFVKYVVSIKDEFLVTDYNGRISNKMLGDITMRGNWVEGSELRGSIIESVYKSHYSEYLTDKS